MYIVPASLQRLLDYFVTRCAHIFLDIFKCLASKWTDEIGHQGILLQQSPNFKNSDCNALSDPNSQKRVTFEAKLVRKNYSEILHFLYVNVVKFTKAMPSAQRFRTKGIEYMPNPIDKHWLLTKVSFLPLHHWMEVLGKEANTVAFRLLPITRSDFRSRRKKAKQMQKPTKQ